jgi:hypothetical protein
MRGKGGSPPNFLYFTFYYRNFGGEPLVPPIEQSKGIIIIFYFIFFFFLNNNNK